MKLLFILFAVLLSAASSAAPHYHRTRPRVPAATRIIRAVPWKTVVAGGAAAGTVIAASARRRKRKKLQNRVTCAMVKRLDSAASR